MNACQEACISLASALGPFGELLILAIAAVIAYLSRRQVAQVRTDLAATKSEADAYKSVALSIRPVAELAQLRIPPLPLPTVHASQAPRDDERPLGSSEPPFDDQR